MKYYEKPKEPLSPKGAGVMFKPPRTRGAPPSLMEPELQQLKISFNGLGYVEKIFPISKGFGSLADLELKQIKEKDFSYFFSILNTTSLDAHAICKIAYLLDKAKEFRIYLEKSDNNIFLIKILPNLTTSDKVESLANLFLE